MYVERNEAGVIVTVATLSSGDITEPMADDDPELEAFLNPPVPPSRYDQLLDAVDEVAANLPSADRAKLDALLAKRDP